jgi:hypothetical protein
MARTSNAFTQAEREAFEAFFLKSGLVMEGEVGKKNGEILADFIANKMDADITAKTLAAAVKVVQGLVWKTAAEREFDAVAGQLTQSEKSTVTNWFERQKQLVQDGDKALENFSILVGWLRARNSAITEQNLNTSLTNVVNNGQRALHWIATPAADRTYVGGKLNHSQTQTTAAPATEPANAWVGGRKNHSVDPQYAPPAYRGSYERSMASKGRVSPR